MDGSYLLFLFLVPKYKHSRKYQHHIQNSTKERRRPNIGVPITITNHHHHHAFVCLFPAAGMGSNPSIPNHCYYVPVESSNT